METFKQHIQTLQERYEVIFNRLKGEGIALDGIFLSSGKEDVYFQDDNHVPFKAFAHFLQWVPVNRSDQGLLIQAGKKPVYFQVIPKDFWYDQRVQVEAWWSNSFDIVELERASEIKSYLPETSRMAFLGGDTDLAAELGFPADLVNHDGLLCALNWERAFKTEYEVACMREANRVAVLAHETARARFMEGGSELDVHLAYLSAAKSMEHESPYMNIVAFDMNSAILHYQYKNHAPGDVANVMLIDAGTTCRYYASDLTRTYARESAHPVFKRLVDGVEKIQLDLVNWVKPGNSYVTIHEKAHEMVLDLLIQEKVVMGSREELVAHQISHIFFPHGIGHLLGLQVHDVGGHYKDSSGALNPPPEQHAFLRLTRNMEPGMVFTIEPGIYFIRVLLDPHRVSEKASFLNWPLIDDLMPFGGIRIEDNILVTEQGAENLTR